MGSLLFEVGLLSIPVIVLFGGLAIFMIFYHRAKSGKKDYTSQISGYENLFKQGKLSKEEYNQIKLAMMRKQGVDLPPEIMNQSVVQKSVRSTMVSSPQKDQSSSDEIESNQQNITKKDN